MTQNPYNIEPEKEPSSFRLISTLGIAGFLSGLILVAVYLYTKPIIAENKAEALKAAVFEVLPQTESFKAMVLDGNSLRELQESEKADEDAVIYFGYDGAGNLSGIAIPGAEPGYQDLIYGIYGYRPDQKTIIGFKVLESKETPGLGDKILSDPDFSANFTRLLVEPQIEVVKKGEKKSENQVEAITGATISSNAIGRLLQKSVEKWKQPVADYLRENQIQLTSYGEN